VNILLVTDSYPPEIRSASHLMLELAQELHARGHSVTVVTTWPEYNLDQDKAVNSFNELEVESGIRVIRVQTLPHHNVNYIVRGIAQLLMPLQFLIKLKKYASKPDAVVVYSPPLPLALVGSWFRCKGARYLLNVQDLFPQNAIDLGILNNQLQIRFFRALERFSYRNADIVTIHSDGNKKMLELQYPEIRDRLRILHNWVDIEHHEHTPVKTNFREKWAIKQKFIAVFAGVMGPSQYLELILDIAEKMQANSDLLFLFVGDGKEKEALERLAKTKALNNVLFKPFISRDEYPDLLDECDVGLVCLSPKNKTPVVPGKILGHMAAALPVVAFLHAASDGHSLIDQANCGASADSSDFEACLMAMQNLVDRHAELQQLGNAGKKYAKLNFSKQNCVSQLESILLKKS
jgi:colanic acid biosynthesis glycosyl transferase WcaI